MDRHRRGALKAKALLKPRTNYHILIFDNIPNVVNKLQVGFYFHNSEIFSFRIIGGNRPAAVTTLAQVAAPSECGRNSAWRPKMT